MPIRRLPRFRVVWSIAAHGVPLGIGIAAGPLSAQDAPTLVRVSVHVESRDGTALDDAHVRARRESAQTNAEGDAELALAPGDATVEVVRVGFEPGSVDITVPGRGEIRVTVVLKGAGPEADAVIVRSTRADRRVSDEPVSVHVVTRERVEGTIASTPGDLAMLLDGTAGVRAQPTSPSFGGVALRLRGFRGRHTLVLSDGMPLYAGRGSSQRPLQIPLMDVGHVEVVEGAASALYGAGALAGVVNLVSRRPEPSRELLMNGSSLGGMDAALWLADEWSPRWGYTFLGAVHRQTQGDVDGDGWADVLGSRGVLVRPRLFWNDGRGRSVLVTVGGLAEDREGGTVEGVLHPTGTPYSTEVRTRHADFGVVARAPTRGGLLTLRGSTSVQQHGYRYGDIPEYDRDATAFAEASLTGTAGPHVWTVGTALQHDVYRADHVEGFDYTHTVPALFAQNEATLTRHLTLSLSARLDAHSTYGNAANARLSGLLRLAAWTVRASAGTGFFAPTPFMEETEAVGLTRAAPLRGVGAERARSASLDVGTTVRRLALSGSLFAASIEGALAAVPAETRRGFLYGSPTPGGSIYALVNQVDPTRVWGAEMRVGYVGERVELAGTYVHTRATENQFECLYLDPFVDAFGLFSCRERSRREVPRTPRHVAGTLVSWEHDDRSRVRVELRYIGRQELEADPFGAVSKGYVELGVLGERSLGGARVFLSADNLLDARQTRWSGLMRQTRSRQGRWANDVWAPLEGRVFGAGVRLAL